MAAIAVAACGAVAGCVSSGPDAEAFVRHQAPETPRSFTRLDMTRGYALATVEARSIAADADPSYAAAHEGDRSEGFAHVENQAVRPLLFRVEADIPAGWRLVNADTLVHDLSGLECPMALDLTQDRRRYVLIEIKAFDTRSLDVACDYSSGDGAAITFFASFWPRMSLEEGFAGSAAAIRQRFPVVGALPVAVASLEATEGDPVLGEIESVAASGFDIGEVNGAPYKTSLWLTKTLGWHVKARATYAQDDMSTELLSAIMFAFSHANVRAKNLTKPVTEGGEV